MTSAPRRAPPAVPLRLALRSQPHPVPPCPVRLRQTAPYQTCLDLMTPPRTAPQSPTPSCLPSQISPDPVLPALALPAAPNRANTKPHLARPGRT